MKKEYVVFHNVTDNKVKFTVGENCERINLFDDAVIIECKEGVYTYKNVPYYHFTPKVKPNPADYTDQLVDPKTVLKNVY